MSNRKVRRNLARANQTLGRKHLAGDMCRLCAFVATEIIGDREKDFVLPDGSQVELGINKRLEPPLGLRFPKSAAKRTPCLACGMKGKLKCADCNGTGQPLIARPGAIVCQTCLGNGSVACEKCAGFGYNWTADDFAPLCILCSQYTMAWLREREQLALVRLGKPEQKIILPGATTQRTGRIVLQ